MVGLTLRESIVQQQLDFSVFFKSSRLAECTDSDSVPSAKINTKKNLLFTFSLDVSRRVK
jgi:hypothetical protein